MLLFDVGHCPRCEPKAGWLFLSGECGDALIRPMWLTIFLIHAREEKDFFVL